MRQSTQTQYLQSIYPDLKSATDTMSRYDALCLTNRIAFEMKSRMKHYPTTRLERKKLDGMKDATKSHTDVKLYYVVYDKPEDKMFIFDLLDLEAKGLLKYEETRNPVTTSFANRQMVLKITCELDWDWAIAKYTLNKKDKSLVVDNTKYGFHKE